MTSVYYIYAENTVRERRKKKTLMHPVSWESIDILCWDLFRVPSELRTLDRNETEGVERNTNNR